MRVLKVPTGHIAIINGDRGKQLEFLAIGDYGKEKNIKADFLGLADEINGVPDGEMMPVEEKLVITVSTQSGCSMCCNFCDVPDVGPGINVTENDLMRQIVNGLKLPSFVGEHKTKRLNIHYARMGEPTFNNAVLMNAIAIKRNLSPFINADVIHPVVSTMMPRNNTNLRRFLEIWTFIKNDIYQGDAGLQLSINSTNAMKRAQMFSDNQMNLFDIGSMMDELPAPVGRKYTLNFALFDDSFIDPIKLRQIFDPARFIVKITPMHVTKACKDNDMLTSGGYDEYAPYQELEAKLKNEGFDVLVFVPSHEEDESGITCGNAILSRSDMPFKEWTNE